MSPVVGTSRPKSKKPQTTKTSPKGDAPKESNMAEVKAAVGVAKVAKAEVPAAKADEAAKVVAAAPAQPPEAKPEKKPRGKASQLAGKKIYLVEAAIRAKMPEGRTDLNPKREGSNGHKAFALYKNGQTVGEFVKLATDAKVGGMADVRWDKEHGFIELKDE